VTRAREATGLNDFGPSDEFRTGLRILIAAASESPLTDTQRDALEAKCETALQTRLRLVDLRNREPQTAEAKIGAPLILIGMPRTGTTALVDMLAQDPAARAPLQWESANLFPPADRANWARDPRIAAMENRLQASAPTNPIVALGLHTFGATLPDECNNLLTLEFWSTDFTTRAVLPRYVEWLRLGQPTRPYLSHKWILQHLQAHGPSGRWTLKSPVHCFALAALVAEYPDAMLVQTHRDPREQVASHIGLICTIRGFGPGHPGRAITAQELLAKWGTGLQRCLAARADPALDSRVMDISHRSVFEDPMGTLRNIYDRFDLDFSAEAERRVRAWLENPAQHRSTARFTLEDFDLTEADVEAAFGAYMQRLSAYF
jgi:hypothetical protein